MVLSSVSTKTAPVISNGKRHNERERAAKRHYDNADDYSVCRTGPAGASIVCTLLMWTLFLLCLELLSSYTIREFIHVINQSISGATQPPR